MSQLGGLGRQSLFIDSTFFYSSKRRERARFKGRESEERKEYKKWEKDKIKGEKIPVKKKGRQLKNFFYIDGLDFLTPNFAAEWAETQQSPFQRLTVALNEWNISGKAPSDIEGCGGWELPPLFYLYIRGRGDLLQKILCCRFMDRFFQTRNIFDERKKLPKENVNFLAFHAYKLACFRNERGLNFDRQDESRFVIKEILKDTSRPSTSFYFSLLFPVLRFKEHCPITGRADGAFAQAHKFNGHQ